MLLTLLAGSLWHCAVGDVNVDSGAGDARDIVRDTGGCTSNTSCAGSTAGPICDTTRGVCVGCLTAPMDTCPSGQYCDAMSRCTAGCRTSTDCASGTVPMQCDPATHHCTGCTTETDCAPGTICSAGACIPGCSATHPCAVGGACCNNLCVTTGTDPTNCGACGTACGSDGVCCAGHCATTTTDIANCGACGHTCSTANVTEACSAGACTVRTCAPGFSDCDADPANGCEAPTSTDVANCGACRNACPSGTNSTATCAASTCGLTCTAGFGDCDANRANGCESQLNSDPANCSTCGHACAAGANATAACAMGVCGRTCAAGFGDCDGNAANGCETNLGNTAASCGACGSVCSLPNAVASCAAGVCGIGACSTGWGNCDGIAANGCETSLTTNTHCGACATVCGAGSLCSGGACSGVCTAPTTNCSGACVNTSIDLANCGGCGRPCATPFRSVARCAAGACGFTCNSGFGDCDGDPANGCETSLSTTLTSCGACGRVCAAPANASATCVGSACGIGACNPGFADCDGNGANGCEANLSGSATTCGACANACTTPAHGTPACSGGACGLASCDPGWGDCNGSLADGCETDLGSSTVNCGACGTVCGPGTACSAGACGTICAAPTTYCSGSGTCANLQTDSTNCGTCGYACSGSTACSAGTCGVPPPPNDRCTAASPINLSVHSTTISTTTVSAAHDATAPCSTAAGADVFFSFTLTQPELVYADTFGSTFDTILFFANSCTTGLPLSAASTGLIECDDDSGGAGCSSGGLQSQVTAYLQPG
ncbi:MAG: hypothetical protein WCJ30_14075, partial [Deltaproteobacteria bacterium]